MTHPVPEHLDLVGLLVLGLLGGFGHCVGMCSPFVIYVAARFSEPGARPAANLRPQLLYGLGRIATYAALGAMAGVVGGAVDLGGELIGVRRGAALVAGGGLLLYGLVGLSELLPALPPVPTPRLGARLFAGLTEALKRRRPRQPFVTGLVLGLLPCGLLYGALLAAAARGDALWGAAGMLAFGAGTLPAMLGLALLGDLLVRRRGLLLRIGQVFVLAMGGMFLWRGLSL